MIRTWPSLANLAHLPTRLVGEVILAALIVAALAFSPRDGVPTSGFVSTAAPASGQSGIASMQVSGNNLSGKPILASTLPVVGPAPPPEPRIPTSAPVELLIPTLDVHRAVEKIGVNALGVMNLPVNAWNAGWYKGGPVPGAPGDAVIEGHAGYPGQPMIFGKLATLKPGDQIIVVHADGTRRLFLVTSMRSVPADSFPSGLAEPSGPARLTLVTCTGHFDKKNFWYSDRLLVEARYAGLA